MKHFLLGFAMGLVFGSSVIAIAAGATKWETSSNDAKSMVVYGTADSGDTIVRLKTNADGAVYVEAV